MGIIVKGYKFDPDFKINIKEQDIRNTIVKVPEKYYQAKASLETWDGSVEITGSTLHNIIQQFLVQNKHFRIHIKTFIDDLDKGNEYLYSAKKY